MLPCIRAPGGLTNALDSALALLQSSGVPGQVDIDERAQALKIEALRCGVGAQQKLEVTSADPVFEHIAVTALESAITP